MEAPRTPIWKTWFHVQRPSGSFHVSQWECTHQPPRSQFSNASKSHQTPGSTSTMLALGFLVCAFVGAFPTWTVKRPVALGMGKLWQASQDLKPANVLLHANGFCKVREGARVGVGLTKRTTPPSSHAPMHGSDTLEHEGDASFWIETSRGVAGNLKVSVIVIFLASAWQASDIVKPTAISSFSFTLYEETCTLCH